MPISILTMSAKRKILVVEDHANTAEELRLVLTKEGHTVAVAGSRALARKALAQEEPNLLVLDVNLPDGTGFDICRELRDEGSSVPVLFLTERGDEDSLVKGLSPSGTDYMRKPFKKAELLLRLKRLFRQAPAETAVGDLCVFNDEKKVTWKGKAISLTPREFEVLSVLAQNAGRLVTRERMVEESGNLDVDARTFNSYLSRLKKKLADGGVKGIEITAVYGEGYRLERK